MSGDAPAPSEVYLAEVESWRRELDERLRRPDGWLALAGLHWLRAGANSLGSSVNSDLRLPLSAPADLGVLELREGKVFYTPASENAAIDGAPPPGEPLRPDTTGDPHRLRWGEITFVVIGRGNRIGLRVWDNGRRERREFAGRIWFPVDRAARIEARFEPAGSGERIAVPNQLGQVEQEPLLGAAVFRWQRSAGRLLAIDNGDGNLKFLFGDRTNGDTTYPAGRFLIATPPQDRQVVLDFNRAYNPPCAFTDFATCPLPPESNHLSFPIPAGERSHPSGDHPTRH